MIDIKETELALFRAAEAADTIKQLLRSTRIMVAQVQGDNEGDITRAAMLSSTCHEVRRRVDDIHNELFRIVEDIDRKAAKDKAVRRWAAELKSIK